MVAQETDCRTRHTQLDRVREIADRWTRDQLGKMQSPSETLAATLIVLGPGDQELARDANPLFQGADGPLSRLIPRSGIVRLLRERHASAAAVVAPLESGVIGLQLADLEREQSLTARVVQLPDTTSTIDKWDFGRMRWPIALRRLLIGALKSDPAPAPRPAAAEPVKPQALGQDRRALIRELREQLRYAGAAAPSWLQ